MGILTMIITIKQIHKEDLTILKIGKFYYCYGKDVYIISYFFNYKLNLVENTYSCGFPDQSLNKQRRWYDYGRHWQQHFQF